MKKNELDLLLTHKYRFVKEYRFHTARRWRFDYAKPDLMLAIEYEGGIWTKGRHTRGVGYSRDCEKYNQATSLGWRILRYTCGSDLSDVVEQVENLIGLNKIANKKT